MNPTHADFQQDDISFQSLQEDVEGYSWEAFRADLHAGLTVALVTVPQAMAFALVAGLPMSCGLLAAIFSSILASIFGSCRQMVIGPNNAISVLIQFGTAEILYNSYRDVVGPDREMVALQVLTQLSFLVGLFQLGAVVFKLGRLTQFVSLSVVVGYQAGTALALVTNQLFPFFGMDEVMGLNSLFAKLMYFFSHLHTIHGPTAIVGLTCLVLLILLRNQGQRIPSAVIVLALSTLLVHVVGFSSYSELNWLHFNDIASQKVTLVGDEGDINQLLPNFVLPYFSFSLLNQLLPMAFAIALLSTIETTLVAKSISASSGQRLSVNQELLGLGIANLFSAFIGAMPSSGSMSRSSLLFSSGARTRFAGMFNSLWVWVIVMLFGFFVQRTPVTALSALLFVSSVYIVRWDQLLLCVKATPADALVFVVTVISCLIFGLDVAFYVGVVFSVTLYLKKAAVPYLVECRFDDSGSIGSTERVSKKDKAAIRVINVQGELFFGAADLFQNMLKTFTADDQDLKVVILRLKNARDMDATACFALQQLHRYLASSGRHLLACGLTQPTWEVLLDSGTVSVIGRENLFVSDEKQPKASLQKALMRAKELMRRPALQEETPLSSQLSQNQLLQATAK